MKNQYLTYIQDKKYLIEYYRLHYRKSIIVSRRIRYLLAIAGTGSLAGFYFIPHWKEILVGIAAFTQVFSSIQPYLPYDKRCVDLDKQIFAMEAIFRDIDNRWYLVNHEILSPLEINDLITKFEEQWANSQNGMLQGDDLPENLKFAEQAGKTTRKYMRKYKEN